MSDPRFRARLPQRTPGPLREGSTGRSLGELLVGMAVVALVLTLGLRLPAAFGHAARVETLSRELLSAMRFARSEALTRGLRVAVCPTNDPQAVEPTCAGPSASPGGWLVFTDDLENPANQPGVLDRPGDALLRVVRGDPSVTVTTSHPDAGNWIAYDPRGMLLGANGWLATDIVFCLNGSAGVVSLRTSGSASVDQRRC